MKSHKKIIIWLSLLFIVSYIFATHYFFQWWSALLGVILFMIVILVIKTQIFDQLINNYSTVIMTSLLIGVFILPKGLYKESIYDDCAYPPFKLKEETEIPINIFFNPVEYDINAGQGLHTSF